MSSAVMMWHVVRGDRIFIYHWIVRLPISMPELWMRMKSPSLVRSPTRDEAPPSKPARLRRPGRRSGKRRWDSRMPSDLIWNQWSILWTLVSRRLSRHPHDDIWFCGPTVTRTSFHTAAGFSTPVSRSRGCPGISRTGCRSAGCPWRPVWWRRAASTAWSASPTSLTRSASRSAIRWTGGWSTPTFRPHTSTDPAADPPTSSVFPSRFHPASACLTTRWSSPSDMRLVLADTLSSGTATSVPITASNAT